MDSNLPTTINESVVDYQGLTYRDRLIIMARAMFNQGLDLALTWINSRLPENERIAKDTYYRVLKRVGQEANARLRKVALDFSAIIADEVVKLDLIEQELWEQYNRLAKDDPVGASKILMNIVSMQPLKTSLITEVKLVIENNALIEHQTKYMDEGNIR